mmetsp:Transcript_10363/g.26551  ORF Transcript_10363/g.26551 Transcript_10363/m.26551 type:complete len:245 (+) Transcript_10363:600-1334(+)
MVVLGIGNAGKSKVADLEVAVAVQENVTWLEVAMDDVGRMDVFEPAENLVREVADVVVGNLLCLQQSEQVCLHQLLHDIHVGKVFERFAFDNVCHADDVFMLNSAENFDFTESALAVRLMFERGDLFDRYPFAANIVQCRAHHAVGSLTDEFEARVPWFNLEPLLPHNLDELVIVRHVLVRTVVLSVEGSFPPADGYAPCTTKPPPNTGLAAISPPLCLPINDPTCPPHYRSGQGDRCFEYGHT